MTTIKSYYTFSTEGLNEKQILFLEKIETLFFAGENISLKNEKVKALLTEFEKGQDLLEAWEYWNGQKHAEDRQSLKSPVTLPRIFPEIYGKKVNNSFWVRKEDNSSFYATINEDYFKALDLSIIYDLTPNNFYFQLFDDGRLFLNYQYIIGSRFIAQTTDRQILLNSPFINPLH